MNMSLRGALSDTARQGRHALRRNSLMIIRRLLTALAYGASVGGKSKNPPRNDILTIILHR